MRPMPHIKPFVPYIPEIVTPQISTPDPLISAICLSIYLIFTMLPRSKSHNLRELSL